jgi:3-dehydroquinate dehydratase / shikimate dehydrogenase
VNQGKICISICAETADDLIDKIRRAEGLADVIEVRFDCLREGTELDALERLKTVTTSCELLATFRPKEESGKAEPEPSSPEERNEAFQARLSFWKAAMESRLFKYLDFEEDLIFTLTYNDVFEPSLLAGHTIIGSHHNFYETPPELGPVLEKFKPDPENPFNCGIVKIATTANTITDTIEQWYLLDWAKHFGIEAIPISMGEPGKWTRILGLANGAAMTYAALDAGGETAPGQITARDLIDVYRVKELDAETEIFGIIAGDTSYSMSPYIQNAAFKAAGMNRVFVPLQTANVGEFVRRMVRQETREIELNFRGFAVTNPHKQAIIEHLDEIDEAAKAIGAVNTVSIEGGRLLGTNTDAAGFIAPLIDMYGDLNGARVDVVGAGGAARACVFALKEHGADVTIFARDLHKAHAIAHGFGTSLKAIDDSRPFVSDIVVNTTPIGTRGKSETETIATADRLDGVKLVYDLTYNPQETVLLKEAKTAGRKTLGGLDMLIAQGARQFEIWTGEKADVGAMRRAALERLQL